MKLRNIGRYQVKAELNRGGMSVVYLAFDPRVGRDVAIKMLPRSLQDQPNVRARFEREARTIAMLEHPAIVPIYDFGEEDGQPYLVMRYMQGGSLADLLTYGRLNLTDAARITQRIAGALDEAHALNVIHRDLKPGNILFDTHGEAFLTDFGIVKLYENEANQTTLTGSVVLGTPAYMSPEQALGKPIDRRSDVYSLGAVLYEMLTGIPPYKGPTGISIAMKHVVDPVPNVREYRPDLPEACTAVVETALSKEPGDRYASASEMAEAFAAAAAPAASTEMQMPPVVVRRRPQTTSTTSKVSAADAELAADASTTETARPVAAVPAPAPKRPMRWGAIAMAGAIALLVVSIGVAALGLLAQQARSAQPAPTPTQTATATAQGIATLPALLTPTPDLALTAPIPTREVAPTLPLEPIAPDAVRLSVTGNGANVRTGPSTAYPVITQLAPGVEIDALSRFEGPGGRWYEVRLPSGAIGWVSEIVVTANDPSLADALPISTVTPPPLPTPLPTQTPTATPTPSPVPTLLVTPTPILTPTLTVAPTLFPTAVPPPTIIATPELPPTAAPTPTPTAITPEPVP